MDASVTLMKELYKCLIYQFKANFNAGDKETLKVSIRPEQIRFSNDLNVGLKGEITLSTFLGDFAIMKLL